MRILVDAMGGDYAPDAVVNGCLDALNEKTGFEITLIGKIDAIQAVLSKKNYPKERLHVHPATDVITMEDHPVKAIRGKKDSSMVVGYQLLKEGKGDVFISAGNTGALMSGALLILGRIEGVDRPALPTVVPTQRGKTLMIDSGANTMCKPINYLQFGIMGSIYMREVFGIENPSVGLINVGSEESKGNETIKQAYSLLAESHLNFAGNAEGKDIPKGKMDVVVCDGFVGNVVLKFMEGIGLFIFDSLKEVFAKSLLSKISALLIRSNLKQFKRKLDPSEYGGVPLLGVKGKVVKAHGNSNAKAVKNAIFKGYDFAASKVVEQIGEEFKNTEVGSIEQDNA